MTVSACGVSRTLDLQVALPSAAATIWPSYFPATEFSMADQRFKRIAQLEHLFSSPEAAHIISQVQNDGGLFFLPIDMQQFQKLYGAEKFDADLKVAPKEAILCMGAAAHMSLLLRENNCHFEDVERINIRLHNIPESMITLKSLKAGYIGKLVSVRGTVVKVSTVRPLVLQMDFTCAKCGSIITRIFPDGKFSPPLMCSVYGCKSRTFTPIRSTAKPIDFQKIRQLPSKILMLIFF